MSPTAAAKTTAAVAGRRRAVPAWAIGITFVIALMFAAHILTDRYAPFTPFATVEAQVVPMAPQVTGRVDSVDVYDNELVKAGDILFRLDPTVFEAKVQQAEAALVSAGQTLGASTADISAAQARVAEERAKLGNVEQQASRVFILERDGIYSAARGDQARTEVDRSRASLQAAQQQLESLKAARGPVDARNPQIRSALAALEQARYDLAQTRVLAPFDGIVTNLRLSPGQVVNAGSPAVALVDIRDAWITAFFRENQMEHIRRGSRAEITFDIRPGEIMPARIASFGPGISTPSLETPIGQLTDLPKRGWLSAPQRFPLRVVLEDETGPPPWLRIGAQASVVAYPEEGVLARALSWLRIRVAAVLSYAY